MEFAGVLKITNPKTLAMWKDNGKYEKLINEGFIYAKGCGRFKLSICECTKCKNKKDMAPKPKKPVAKTTAKPVAKKPNLSNVKKEMINQNKQTAVDWFFQEVKKCNEKPWLYVKIGYISGLYEQAKQMEKEQIINAWNGGDFSYFYSKETGRDFEDGEQYYNEVYGGGDE